MKTSFLSRYEKSRRAEGRRENEGMFTRTITHRSRETLITVISVGLPLSATAPASSCRYNFENSQGNGRRRTAYRSSRERRVAFAATDVFYLSLLFPPIFFLFSSPNLFFFSLRFAATRLAFQEILHSCSIILELHCARKLHSPRHGRASQPGN